MRNSPAAATPAGRADACAALRGLIALLQREQELLVQPAVDALNAIAAEKQALLKKLHSLGLTASAVSARAQPRELEPEILELTRRAQWLNTANSRLLSMHRTFCENRLRLLRGDSGKTLYGASGYLAS